MHNNTTTYKKFFRCSSRSVIYTFLHVGTLLLINWLSIKHVATKTTKRKYKAMTSFPPTHHDEIGYVMGCNRTVIGNQIEAIPIVLPARHPMFS